MKRLLFPAILPGAAGSGIRLPSRELHPKQTSALAGIRASVPAVPRRRISKTSDDGATAGTSKAPLHGMGRREGPGRNGAKWVDVGMFLAMASMLVSPTGALGGTAMLACSLLYLTYQHGHGDRRPLARQELWFLGSVTLYPLVAVLHRLASDDPGAWHYLDNPSRFLLALPIYWAIRNARATRDALVTGAIVGVSAAGMLSVYQWGILDYAAPRGHTNAIPFSHILTLLICVALIPTPLPGRWKLLRAAAVGIGLVSLLLAQVRGAWIAIPILLLLMTGWFPERKPWIRTLAASAAIAVMTGVLLAVPFTHARVVNTIDNVSAYLLDTSEPVSIESPDYSIYCRFELWRSAWELFSARPWTGNGFGQFEPEVDRLMASGLASRTACDSASYPSMSHAHNDWMELGAEMGIPGIMTYLLPLVIIYAVGRRCCRNRRNVIGVSLKIYAVGQGILSLTQTQLSHNLTTTFFVFMAVVLVALAFNEMDAEERPPSDPLAGGRERVVGT